MDLGIAGRTAVVTGASMGLGLATAQALAEEGCNLVVCSRTVPTLQRAAEQLKSQGVDVLAVPGDVTAPDVVQTLVTQTLDRFGRLDILVPNLAGPPATRALDVSAEQLTEALRGSLQTPVALMQAVLPIMREQQWGRICAISSISIKQPIAELALSGTSRAGLWAWIKLAARELVADGITVNLACPDVHATERASSLGFDNLGFGGHRMGDPGDFGKVVCFLCSQPANFITGSAVSVDGGAVAALL